MVKSPKKYLFLFFLFIMTFPVHAASAETAPSAGTIPEKGSITGKIMIKDAGPLADGQVMFYNAASGPPPSPDKYERTPDHVRELDAEGVFDVELPAGRYFLGAAKRKSGERMGPPQAGDLVWRSVDGAGKPKEYVIEPGKRLDIGTITEAAPLKASARLVVTTAFEGIVTDAMGVPVRDAVVVAFLRPAVQTKPVFVSKKTGKDGKYVLPVTPGTYYLRVRNAFASGPPEPGQIVGYYGEGQPAPVTVTEGQILKGVHFRVILFPGRGPFSNTAPAGK
jgi:hypothetical protein